MASSNFGGGEGGGTQPPKRNYLFINNEEQVNRLRGRILRPFSTQTLDAIGTIATLRTRDLWCKIRADYHTLGIPELFDADPIPIDHPSEPTEEIPSQAPPPGKTTYTQDYARSLLDRMYWHRDAIWVAIGEEPHSFENFRGDFDTDFRKMDLNPQVTALWANEELHMTDDPITPTVAFTEVYRCNAWHELLRGIPFTEHDCHFAYRPDEKIMREYVDKYQKGDIARENLLEALAQVNIKPQEGEQTAMNQEHRSV